MQSVIDACSRYSGEKTTVDGNELGGNENTEAVSDDCHALTMERDRPFFPNQSPTLSR